MHGAEVGHGRMRKKGKELKELKESTKNATLYENSKIVNDVFARIIGGIFIKVSSRKTDGMGES